MHYNNFRYLKYEEYSKSLRNYVKTEGFPKIRQDLGKTVTNQCENIVKAKLTTTWVELISYEKDDNLWK